MKKSTALVLIILVFLTACDRNSEQTSKQTQIETKSTAAIEPVVPLGQLGDKAVPTHYGIELTLNTDKDVLSGKVTITVNLKESTNNIYLHGKDLKVDSVSVKANGRLQQGRYEQVHKSGISKISWDENLAGEIQIEIDYEATYSESLDSIYKVNESGKTYLFSQMESISARMSIPSFDEPQFKTPFDLIVTAKVEDKVITNTPEINTESLDNGMVRHTFATTKLLPTYLLAFAIGDLDVVDFDVLPPTEIRKRPITLRGIAVKGKGEMMDYALANTRVILESLENYFGVAYPYEKLDIIAVPDFAFGAMENAGAIVYRENLVLLDEKSPLRQKMAYGGVHAHELSHQWFGNLVTPKWWDDIWLNEAFASWIQNKAAHDWKPDYEYDRTITRKSFSAMAMDARSSARQIRQPIESNDDIMNAFDGITYTKGASVLQMFENMLGKEAFRKGVQLHMQRFAFGSADVNDFAKSLADGGGNADIIPAFESFLYQSGTPYLDATISCGANQARVEVNQSRYVPMGIEKGKEQQWILPLCYKTDQGEGCEIIRQKQQEFTLDHCPGYFMPNRNGAGYYRWNLSEEQWQHLTTNMAFLDANEQLGLINNIIAAFRANKASLKTLLDIFHHSSTSENWDVIVAPLRELRALKHALLNDKFTPTYKSLINDLYASHFKALGFWPNTKGDERNATTTALLRRQVVGAMATQVQDQIIRKQLVELAKGYLGKNNQGINRDVITPDLVSLALSVVVEDSDTDFARQLLERGLNSVETVFREDVLLAMTQTKDIAFGKSLVDELLLSDKVRSNEAQKLIGYFMSNPDYREYTWAWLQANLDEFLKRYSSFSVARAVSLGGHFCDKESRDNMQAFYLGVQDKISGAPRKIAEMVEMVNQCIALRAAYADDWAEL